MDEMWTCHAIHTNANEQHSRWWKQMWHYNVTEWPWNGDHVQVARAVLNLTLAPMDGSQRLICVYHCPWNNLNEPATADVSLCFPIYQGYGKRSDLFGWGYLPREWELVLQKFPLHGRTATTTFPYAVTFQDVIQHASGEYMLKSDVSNPDFVTVNQVRFNQQWDAWGCRFYCPGPTATGNSLADWALIDHCTFKFVSRRQVDYDSTARKSAQGQQILPYVKGVLWWWAEMMHWADEAAGLSGPNVPRWKVDLIRLHIPEVLSRVNQVRSFLYNDWGLPIYPTRARRRWNEPNIPLLQQAASDGIEALQYFEGQCNDVLNAFPFTVPASYCEMLRAIGYWVGAVIMPLAWGHYSVQPRYSIEPRSEHYT